MRFSRAPLRGRYRPFEVERADAALLILRDRPSREGDAPGVAAPRATKPPQATATALPYRQWVSAPLAGRGLAVLVLDQGGVHRSLLTSRARRMRDCRTPPACCSAWPLARSRASACELGRADLGAAGTVDDGRPRLGPRSRRRRHGLHEPLRLNSSISGTGDGAGLEVNPHRRPPRRSAKRGIIGDSRRCRSLVRTAWVRAGDLVTPPLPSRRPRPQCFRRRRCRRQCQAVPSPVRRPGRDQNTSGSMCAAWFRAGGRSLRPVPNRRRA